MSGATLTASHASQVVTSTVGADGSYRLQIAVENLEQDILLVSMATDGFAQQASVISGLSALFSEAATDRALNDEELSALNITYLSSADYLLQQSTSSQSATNLAKTEAASISLQRRMTLAAFMKLLAEEEGFAKPQNAESLLAYLSSESYSDPEQAMHAYLISIGKANQYGNLEYGYQLALDTAQLEIAQQESVSTSFNMQNLVERTVVLLPDHREGFLPDTGLTLTLNQDGTGGYNKNITNTSPEAVNWQITGNKLHLNYHGEHEDYRIMDDVISYPHGCFKYCSEYQKISAEFGPETAQLIEDNAHLLVSSQIQLITRETSRTVLPLPSSNGEVVLVTLLEKEKELVLPEQIRPDSGNPIARISESFYDQAILNYPRLLAQFDSTAVLGSWAIPIQRGDNPFTGMTVDVVDFDNETAKARYAQSDFSWQLNAGVLTLQGSHYKYEITPIRALDDEWLAIINRYENDQLVFTRLEKMARFNDSASNFEQQAISQIPQVLFKQQHLWHEDNWLSNTPKPDSLFGHQLSADGTMLRGIAVSHTADGEGLAFYGSDRFTWSIDTNNVDIRSASIPRRRTWDIVSVAEDGTILVLEQRFWWIDYDIPDSEHELIESSLTKYKNHDLTDWPEIWANAEL